MASGLLRPRGSARVGEELTMEIIRKSFKRERIVISRLVGVNNSCIIYVLNLVVTFRRRGNKHLNNGDALIAADRISGGLAFSYFLSSLSRLYVLYIVVLLCMMMLMHTYIVLACNICG